MIFNPASRDVAWDPKIMAAQEQLRQSGVRDPLDYGEGFTGSHEGIGSWFTSGLSGQLLSKFADDDSQKDWFIQRNSIELVGKVIDKELSAYKAIADARGLTQQEYDHVEDLISRKNMIKRDLGLVFDHLDGDMDASLDKGGKSFNQRWGFDEDEEQGLMAVLKILKENPTYTAGVLSAELIKDLPLLGLARFLGVAVKGLSFSSIVTRVANKLAGIQPIALKGLKLPLKGAAQVGTGVGAGAVAGAGYEASFSYLEQGTVKGDDTWMGAKFGGAFGLLGGAGLMYKGRLINKGKELEAEGAKLEAEKGKSTFKDKVISGVEDAVDKAGKAIPPIGAASEVIGATGSIRGAARTAVEKATSTVSDNVRTTADNLKRVDTGDSRRIEEASLKDLILPEYDQQVVKRTNGSQEGSPMESTYDDIENRIYTIVKEQALKAEHKRVRDELNSKDLTFRGERLTKRQYDTLDNATSYRAMLLANEKAKVAIRLDADSRGERLSEAELNDRAFMLALNKLNEFDDNFQGPTQYINKSNRAAQAFKEEGKAEMSSKETDELDRIKKARMDGGGNDIGDGEILPPYEPGILGKALQDHPKKLLAAGAALGYAQSSEDEGFYGAALGAMALGLGPKAYRGLMKTPIKATAMKAKVAISKSIEAFANHTKILEFQMQVILDEVADVFEGYDAGMRLINALEDPRKHWDSLTDAEKALATRVRNMLNVIGEEGVKSGVLRKGNDLSKMELHGFKNNREQGSFLQNYFPHLFNNFIDDVDYQDFVIQYLKASRSGDKRKIEATVAQLKNKFGKDAIIDDPVRALSMYTQAMTRTIYGKNLLNSLLDLNLSMNGKLLPGLMSKKVFEKLKRLDEDKGGLGDNDVLHYEEFEHPSLEGYVAHTDIKRLIDDQFVVLRKGGIWDVAEGVLQLNNGLKRIFVFGSLFHAQALMMSAAYALGPSGLVKGIKGGKVSIKDADGKVTGTREANWSDLKIGSGEFNELAEEAIKAGLQIIGIKRQELVNPGLEAIEKLLEKLGPAGAMANKAFKGIDFLTWEYLHDRFKLAAYLKHKEKMMKAMRKDGMTEAEVKKLDEVSSKKAAEFANDAFGSLDWNDFTTRLYSYALENPNKLRGKIADKIASLMPVKNRRFLNMFLFAPDWTISNIRIIGKTFSGLPKVSKALAKRVQKGNWEGDPEAEAVFRAWNMYAAYTMRAGITTSAMWWAISEMFSDEEPTMEALGEFWGGETSGKLQLGGGESVVISKQIAEPIHWLQHPQHTLLNKGSIIPKTLVEGMYNKQWFSMKKGFPMGPEIIDADGTSHTSKWLFGKMVPIVTKPMFDNKLSWSERFERTFTGFFGFPQYGKEAKGRYND